MTEQPVPVPQPELESWVRDIEQAESRQAFLRDGRLDRVVQTIQGIASVCLAGSSSAQQPWKQLHIALRLLRNISALGGAQAAEHLVAASVPDALAATASAVLQHQPQEQEEQQQADKQLALVITAQALGNLAMSSSAGAAGVWQSLYPAPLQQLLAHDAPKVHDPATMCLYACCRASSGHSQQLCSGLQGRSTWETLLQRAVSDQQASSQRAKFEEGPPPGCSEWLSLLISCVCLKRGLLWDLLQCLGQHAFASASGQQQQTAAWSRYAPVALHILAHEATVSRSQQQQEQQQQHNVPDGEAQAVDLSGLHISAEHQQLGSQSQLPWEAKALPPWHKCLLQVLHTCILAARSVAAPAGDGSCRSTQGGSHAAEASRHGAAVLEASLEVLRSLGMRDDMGRGLTGGACDPVMMLGTQHGLVHHILGMLATLQPIQNPRRKEAAAAGSTQASAGTMRGGGPLSPLPALPSTSTDAASPPDPAPSPAAQQQQHSSSQQPVLALPRHYTEELPVLPPYIGYRGDLLGVLANVMYDRPRVAEAVAAVPGAVELLLSQCQLDDSSPLAKEWGLWAIRNLCAGSEAARKQIAALQPVAAVESPELSALGMRMEWDSSTGRMKVVRTEPQP